MSLRRSVVLAIGFSAGVLACSSSDSAPAGPAASAGTGGSAAGAGGQGGSSVAGSGGVAGGNGGVAGSAVGGSGGAGGSTGGSGGSGGSGGGASGAGGSPAGGPYAGDASCTTGAANACPSCCAAHHPKGNMETTQVTTQCACNGVCAASCMPSSLCTAGGPDPSDACNACVQKGFDTGSCDTTSCTNDPDCVELQDCQYLCPTAGAGGAPAGCTGLSISSDAACTACVESKCCDAIAVCAASAPCTTLDGCIAACAKGDAACRKACTSKATTAVQFTYSPITSCEQNLCATECGATPPQCGGFTGSTPTCDACYKQKCCDEANACAASDACMTFLYECFDGECNQGSDTACVAKCAAKYPEGAALFEAMLQCGSVECGC